MADADVYRVAKVDDQLGIVFGFACCCLVDGRPFQDSQNNSIPERAMLEATAEFMQGDRPLGEMHDRLDAGQVVFGFPLTSDIAAALGITTSKTGFIIGAKPDAATLAKYRSGALTSFSLGGRHRIVDGVPVG
jgi:hypothetical protein